MIDNIVTVAVHGPVQIFFKTMGMTVVLDHFEMVLHGFKDCGRMRKAWCDRPYRKRKTEDCCKTLLSYMPPRLH